MIIYLPIIVYVHYNMLLFSPASLMNFFDFHKICSNNQSIYIASLMWSLTHRVISFMTK